MSVKVGLPSSAANAVCLCGHKLVEHNNPHYRGGILLSSIVFTGPCMYCECREYITPREGERIPTTMSTTNQLFQFHKLNPDGIQKAEAIAGEFNRLLGALTVFCPTSTREFSITRTKLEEACFYAKKSMAMDPANQLKSGE